MVKTSKKPAAAASESHNPDKLNNNAAGRLSGQELKVDTLHV